MLAAVAVLLVPLLLLVGGAFSLPSLLGQGAASLSPKVSQRTAGERGLAASGSLSRLVQPPPQGSQVAPPRTSHRAHPPAARGARATTPRTTTPHNATRGSTRPTPNSDLGITDAPTTGGTVAPAAPAPATGTRSGGGAPPEPANPGPVDARPPAVSVAGNGTTATVAVDAGAAPVTATVTVAPSGVTVEVAAAGETVSAGTATVTDLVDELLPPAVTTAVTAPVASTAATLLGG